MSDPSEAYARHEERWRKAMVDIGLDPDRREDQFRVSPGFWFELDDAMRRDLTPTLEVVSTTRRTRIVSTQSPKTSTKPASNTSNETREMELLESGMNALMGHS